MKKVVIVGAAGFGREVLEIFKEQNKKNKIWDILGFIDDNKNLHNNMINGLKVLGDINWFKNNRGVECVVAIGEPEVKKKVVEKLKKIGVSFCNIIHPSVIMSEFVELGEGVIICAGNILTVNIKIKNHVIINPNCTIGHITSIDDYCTINPSVNINGGNHIHQGVYIGTNAATIQNIKIGSWSIIGGGAIVIDDIPDNVVAVGVPARIIKKRG